MALLWVDGFEKYGPTGNTINPTDVLDFKYIGDFDERIDIVAGSTGNAIRIDNSNTWLSTPSLTNNRTLICGFAFYFPTNFASANDTQILFDFRSPSMNGYVISYTELTITTYNDNTNNSSINRLRLYNRGSYITQTDNSINLAPATWYYIEMKAYCDDTNGTVELKLDNNTILTYNGDTRGLAEYDFYSGVLWHCDNGQTYYVDDLYICDASGNTNNDFLGSCNVYTLSPTSDVTNNWTKSTGNDAYALLDGDILGSDYVSSNTSGQKCKVALGTVNAPGTIAGVQINCDVGVNTVIPGLNKYVKLNTYNGTGTVNYLGNCPPSVNTAKVCSNFIMEKAADGTAWDSTTINAIKVEVEVA